MRGRGRILAAGAVVAAAVVVLLLLAGGGGKSTRPPTLDTIAATVVRGATAVLIPPPAPAAGAQAVRVALPAALISPTPGMGPPQTDSAAASLYASAGWRGALIAAIAVLQIPNLTQYVTTNPAGAQAPGSAFFLDGSVRAIPGQHPTLPLPKLDKVGPAAERKQLDDNLRTLMSGLPAGSITAVTVSQIPVDPAQHGMAYAVELRVGDLHALRKHLGDLLSGLATGLAPGPDATVEGLAIHVRDAAGRNAGSWMATRSQQGTTVVDPRIRAARVAVPTLHFADETGGPGAVPSAPAGAVLLTAPVRRRPAATVTVPKVTGSYDLPSAYRALRRAGLEMSIPQPFSIRSLCVPGAGSQSPAPGRRVPRWTTVSVRRLSCAVGSPAGGSSQRAAVVPDLTGHSAGEAIRETEDRGLYWELDRLPPLRPSARSNLLDNYVITRQEPAGGSLLARGMPCPGSATPGCFMATPLVMYARAARR